MGDAEIVGDEEAAALVELGHVPPGQRVRGAVEVDAYVPVLHQQVVLDQDVVAARHQDRVEARVDHGEPADLHVPRLVLRYRAVRQDRSAFPAAPCGATYTVCERVAASAGTAPASVNAVAPAATSSASHLDVCRIRQPPWRVTLCR